jgi:hypothetical protein
VKWRSVVMKRSRPWPLLNLPVERMRAALRYYAAYPDEIDAEVALDDEESLAVPRHVFER